LIAALLVTDLDPSSHVFKIARGILIYRIRVQVSGWLAARFCNGVSMFLVTTVMQGFHQQLKELKEDKPEHTLSSNTSVPQNSHPLPHSITHVHSLLLLPRLLSLQIIQLRETVAMHQVHHDDPFGDLRTMHTIGRA
jgi:hypothetical protein